MPNRNSEALRSFIDYCVDHPAERFWQALRNWSGYHLVLVSNDHDVDADPRTMDTFFWEGAKGMEAGNSDE